MPSVPEIVHAYAAAWNEPDEGRRRRLLELAWGEQGVYVDPTAYVAGRAALLAHIAGFQTQMPGARLSMTSDVDEHHGRLRFTWVMRGADGATVAEGIDFGDLDADGRLARIVGFFGPLAAA